MVLTDTKVTGPDYLHNSLGYDVVCLSNHICDLLAAWVLGLANVGIGVP